MHRRSLLAWLGSAGTLGLAGCAESDPEGTTSPGSGTATATPTVPPTRRTPSDAPTATTADTDADTATDTPRASDTASGTRSETESATDAPDGTGTDTPTADQETGTPTPGEGLQRRVALAGVDAVPAGFAVEMDAELLRARVTDARTARLRITTTNTGSPRSISVAPDDCSLLNRSKGGSDRPEGCWLHAPDDAQHVDRDGNRWEADRDPDEPRGYAAYGCLKREYAAGESVSNEYVLWDDYRVAGYLEPGTYRWEEEVSVSGGPTPTGTTSERSFTWGFSLAVREP